MQAKTKSAPSAQPKKANTELAIIPNKAAAKKAEAAANIIDTLIKKEQRFLYKFQTATPKLLPAKAKQYRQKLRRQLDNFIAPILLQKNPEIKAKAIAEFNAFYKAEFILNDFSLKSITDSRDSYKAESLEQILKLAQTSLATK